MLRALVYDTSWWRDAASGSCFHKIYLVTSPFDLLSLKRVALCCLTPIHWKLECLDSSPSSTSAFYLDDVLVGPTRLARMASHLHCYCLEYRYDELLDFCGPQGIGPIEEVLGIFYKMLKRL